jgi:hypothetical protein
MSFLSDIFFKIWMTDPFDYMLSTPLYVVKNTGCPQISPKKIGGGGGNWPPEAFSAPQNAQFFS